MGAVRPVRKEDRPMRFGKCATLLLVLLGFAAVCAAQDALDESIAKTRMGTLRIRTAPGAKVSVEQLRHEFWFGAALANQMFGGSLGARMPNRARNLEGLSYSVSSRVSVPAAGDGALFSAAAILVLAVAPPEAHEDPNVLDHLLLHVQPKPVFDRARGAREGDVGCLTGHLSQADCRTIVSHVRVVSVEERAQDQRTRGQ